MIDLRDGQAQFRIELVRRWTRSRKPVAELLKTQPTT